jgi:NADP-reducing hydrogenase subunit HndC
VVYPDGTWYKKVTPDDVPEIIEKHIENDQPVERLLLPEEAWG